MDSPKILFEVEDDTSTSASATGDLTGSTRPEICTGGRDGILRLYKTDTDHLDFLAQVSVQGSILSISVEDANNDGQMEIVVGRSVSGAGGETGTLQVYRYAPSGQIELVAEQPIGRFVTTVEVTDVTGDDKNEIIAGGSDSTLRVFKMGADNHLEELVCYTLEDMPLCIGTCDVIGDEIDEIVIGNRDKTLRVFKIRGNSADEIAVLDLPSPVISLAAGDILGDRKMELGVVTHDGSIRIYRNEESQLDMFSKLEHVDALSIRMAEINADHMDEIIVANATQEIVFYSLYMAELKQLAVTDIGRKILSISIGDAGGDERKEVLVGVSNGPLKILEGLYEIIPRFEVSREAAAGEELKGEVTVTNATEKSISGIKGKIYWFPKDNMEVEPKELAFDLGPQECKSIQVHLRPLEEGTVVIRPIVLMWTDQSGNVKQVTTPETAISVEEGEAKASPASAPEVTLDTPSHSQEASVETSSSVRSEGTGFGSVTTEPEAETESGYTESEKQQLEAASKMLDDIFGETEPVGPSGDDLKAMTETVTEPEEPPAPEEPEQVESELVTDIRNREPKPLPPGKSEDAYEYLMKSMIVGPGAVGKTALVNRYTTGSFEKDYKTTIGSQFAVKLTHIYPEEKDHAVGLKLQVWDVAGQARFQAVRKMYYSGAAGVILVYDVTRRRSFAELPNWVEEAYESIGRKVPALVVGNKIDLPDRAVDPYEAKKWAEDQGFLYMETSAKTGEGVADMFTILANLMYEDAQEMAKQKKEDNQF